MNINNQLNIEVDNPILTIAIPTFNGGKTIRRTLDSILTQFDQRIEIIILDNASTDGTDAILLEYKSKYSFIKIYSNKTNIGPDANFLMSMRKSQGQFILLLSDDDVLVENSLLKIVTFLTNNKNISLAYLSTVGFRKEYIDSAHCIDPPLKLENDICTTNKEEFMKYAGYYWGFLSSYICSKRDFEAIKNPEQYFGTYWLQSYIHILCGKKQDALLGLISGPCIGAGRYVSLPGFDSALVNGVYYKKMLDYAVKEAGFNKRQLDKLYVWRICLLGKRDIIKERASGMKKTSIKLLIKCTWRYPEVWIKLYPVFFIPQPICSLGMKIYKKRKKLLGNIEINRPGDIN